MIPAECSNRCILCMHTHRSSNCFKSISHLLMVYNESNLRGLILMFLSSSCSCTYADIIVSKTIPTITMKPTDQNGLSLSLSSLLTPIVPLLCLSPRASALSLSLFHPFSSIIGCAHNLSTPLRLRINE